MRKWRHGPRLEVLVLLQVVALCSQGSCPAGELCSACLFCPLGAASLSEGLGVLQSSLASRYLMDTMGRISMEIGSNLYLLPSLP